MGIRRAIARRMVSYGIEPRQLAALLAVYLKQDLRGGNAFAQFGSREYVRSNYALFAIVGLYLLFGLSMTALVFTGIDVFFYSALVLAATLFMVALAIITESGSVIFNESEADVIGHLPISPRTHFTAKAANLIIFTLLLAAAANLFPAIAGVWATGSNAAFFFAHAAAAALIAIFATALVVTSYGLLMRYVSKERFDNIVTYSQVALVLLFSLGYQVFPRLLDMEEINAVAGFRWYYLLFPPAWFSGITMLLMGRIEQASFALAAFALVALLALGSIAMRKVALGYSSRVSDLAYGSAKEIDRKVINANEARTARPARRLFRAIKRAALRGPVEAAVFDLVTIYLRRNREIKVRLYPSLAYFIFLPLLAIFTEGLPDPFVSPSFAFYALMGAAMICFIALTAIEGLVFSEHHLASYIFRVAPVGSLGEIHSGVRKAVLLSIALPAFLLLLALYGALWRDPVHALLVLAPWMVVTPTVLMIPFTFREVLPLSRKYQKGQQSARNISIFLVSFVGMAVLTPLQMLAMKQYFPYWLFLAGVAIASWTGYFLMRKLSKESTPLRPAE